VSLAEDLVHRGFPTGDMRRDQEERGTRVVLAKDAEDLWRRRRRTVINRERDDALVGVDVVETPGRSLRDRRHQPARARPDDEADDHDDPGRRANPDQQQFSP